MAKTRHIPLGTYPSGVYEFGPVATPLGLNGFDIRIGRCTTLDPTIWPLSTTIVTLDMQFSYDNGVTYTPIGANSWTQGGGIIVNRGVEVAESVLSWRFSPNEPTHFKAQITVANGPIRTYLDATVTT
jgi:hypothetical protein